MINLREITTEDMLAECIFRIKVSEEQEKLCDTNVFSLAMAWYWPDTARPFCIYDDDVMVGFLMLECDESENTCEIWNLMIDEKYQGKGYGKAAVKAVIEYFKANPVFENLYVTTLPENLVAIKMFESCGFYLTGEQYENEVVLQLAK